MLPNWECDTDKAKGLAKLGFKSSAAAAIVAAYWALSPGLRAVSISNNPPAETNGREAIEKKKKTKADREDNGGVRVDPARQLPGPKVGSWQKQHELWRKPRIKWVYGYAGGGRLSQTLQHRDLRMLHTISRAAILSDASAPSNV